MAKRHHLHPCMGRPSSLLPLLLVPLEYRRTKGPVRHEKAALEVEIRHGWCAMPAVKPAPNSFALISESIRGNRYWLPHHLVNNWNQSSAICLSQQWSPLNSVVSLACRWKWTQHLQMIEAVYHQHFLIESKVHLFLILPYRSPYLNLSLTLCPLNCGSSLISFG